ncbi:glycosyltransferase family 4 protein [Piscibacillus salipiscarius]|uniref:Glycosyltransferase family 4 protein n=1 Tax=Piscibacillus salipiscarius TaxID=299480 RepID=A0ABW5QAY8_9BACI
MKKNIWILNHYATDMYYNEGGRHYSFASNLKSKDYNPVIFCANTRHNNNDYVDTGESLYVTEHSNGIPFNFVKTRPYEDNGIQRIKNMLSFYKNVKKAAKQYSKVNSKPDIIIASSVHPLALIAGVKLAKYYNIPCITEVRDLWPESLVAYGVIKPNNILTKLLYKGEKWIYKKSNRIIMTWPGGGKYIEDKGWSNDINLNNVHHISNGVELETFDYNCENYEYIDSDLDNRNQKNIVYTGSIRKVNNINNLLDVAKLIKHEGKNDIRFLIFGNGNELENLIDRCNREGINNVIFKGRVDKKFIPSILTKSTINILHNSSTSLDKYGQSQNKLFEYLAAGNPIVQTYTTGFSVYQKYNCGLSSSNQHPSDIAQNILYLIENREKRQFLGENARKASYDFDYKELTNKLIELIEST